MRTTCGCLVLELLLPVDETNMVGAPCRELHTDLMQMLGEATSILHVERAPPGQQSHQHQRTRQEVGERLEALCSRLQTFEDQAAIDRTRNLQASTMKTNYQQSPSRLHA